MRYASILFVLALGCSTLRTESEFRIYRHPNGRPAAEGHVTTHESFTYLIAETEGRPRHPWQKYLRVGKWRYFDERGDIRAELTYRLGSYTECCAPGWCEQPYEIVDGTVRTLAADGTVTYEGPPKNVERVLATNCEGGDRVHVSTLPLPPDIAPSFAQRFAK